MDKKKVFLLSGGHLCCDINSGALPAVLPYLQEAYALSYQATGGIMFAYSLISAATQPFLGMLSDRFTKPWLVPLGVIMAGLGLALTGFAHNYWGVLAAVAMGGLGSSLFHPTAARFANQIGGKHQALTLSIFSIGGNAGFVLGPLLAAALTAVYGLSGTLFFGLLALVTAALLVFSIARMNDVQGGSGAAKGRGSQVHTNNWKQFNRLTVAIIARTVVLSSLHSYLPLYLIHYYGQSKSAAAIAVTVFGVVGVMSNIVGGIASDRWGRDKVLHLSFLPMAPALLIFSVADSLILAWCMLVILALCLYFSFSSMVVLGQQFLARSIGFASGITLGLSTAVGGICAPLVGWIGDNWGLATSFGVLSILALVATVICFFIDPRVNAQPLDSAA